MDKIRIYERGSQDSIMAADMMTVASFDDRKYARAFPAFSVGRRGARAALFIPG
jgi:pyruvate ferredoxin oxidoreductase gamma subunit